MLVLQHIEQIILALVVLGVLGMVGLLAKALGGGGHRNSPTMKKSDSSGKLGGDPKYGTIREAVKANDERNRAGRMSSHEDAIHEVWQGQRNRVRLLAFFGIGRSTALQRFTEIGEHEEREIRQLHIGHKKNKMGKVHPNTGENQHGIGRAGHGTRRRHGFKEVTGYKAKPKEAPKKSTGRKIARRLIIGGPEKKE